jgi:5-formyltetrahydrofolate cyclo-ligase
LRARFKALRASVPAEAAGAAARAVAAAAPRFLTRLIGDAGLAPAQAPVGLYCALPGELDCAPLLGALAALGFPSLLPCAGAKATPLTFRLWRPGDPLAVGKFGLSEPAPDAPEMAPRLVLAPLLAFDARGGRLGFGGGYYDVTLASLRARKILLAAGGLAFARQQSAGLPVEKHDAPLDFVITETGILNFMDGGCGSSSSAT